MGKAKVTAFELDADYAATLATDEPQHFGTIPGLWLPDVPVLLSALDPTLVEADFKRAIKEQGLPIVEVKVADDYSPKKGHSQLELRNRGETTHIPSGPPAADVIAARSGEVATQYKSMELAELRAAGETRQIEGASEMNKTDLVKALSALDAPGDDALVGAAGDASTGGLGGSVAPSGGASTP